MTKFNIDKIVQQKLGELDFKNTGECWNDMEEKLNSSSNVSSTNIGASSGISSTLIITIASISIAALSVISFILLSHNNNNNDESDIKKVNNQLIEVNNSNTVDSIDYIDAVTDNKSEADMNSAEIVVAEPIKKVMKNKTAESKSVSSTNNSTINPNNSNSTNSNTKEKVTGKTVDVVDNESMTKPAVDNSDLNQIVDSKENKVTIEKKKEIKTVDVKYVGDELIIDESDSLNSNYIKKHNDRVKTSLKTNEKEDIKKNNDLKNVTPITKPAKRVFKKRKGVLWRMLN